MTTDRFITRLIAATVCLLGLLAVGAVVVQQGGEVSDTLDRLAFLVVGGIIGALKTTNQGTPTDVNVVNQSDDPVPVDGDAGHGELTTLLVIAAGVLLALIVYYALVTGRIH